MILFSEIELCKSIVLKALQAIDDNDPKALKYSHLAKAKLCKTAKLVTNENAVTLIPAWFATIASGTVDIPTKSAPMILAKLTSAGVS